MRRRLATIFLIATLIFTSGAFEMFAETSADDAAVNNENEAVVDETSAIEETAEEIGEETTEEAVTEDADAEEAVTEEAVTEGSEEEATAEDSEEAAAVEEETEEAILTAQAVTGLTLSSSSVTTNSVVLSWTITKDGTEAVGALTIYKGGTQVETIADPTTVTSYTVTGLDQNTAYTFTAKIGTVSSNTVSVTTAIAAVPGFRKVSSYKTVVLKWDQVSGAAKYYIKVNGADYGSTTGLTLTHKVGTEKDIINLYNTGKGAKFSGNINGKDRYTYTITAKDSSGKVLAESTTTGDIVKTLYYKLTFKAGASLTSHSGGKKTIKIKKGAIVYARGFSDGKYIFDYKCKDGKVRTFYTMKIRVKASLSKHITAVKKKRGTNTQPAYTAEEAEQYVNDRGVTKATTKYMIWANLFSQKEYIFKKSGGKWKVVTANENGLKNKKMYALQISSGKATMPTATGSTKINRKLTSQHGTPLWNVTKYFSVHGVQKSWPTPGWPESGACVRNLNKNATWIYKTIPKYSRVFVH